MCKFPHFCVLMMLMPVFSVIDANAQFIEKKTVSLDLAKKITAAAEEEALTNRWNVVISIVDGGGNLVC